MSCTDDDLSPDQDAPPDTAEDTSLDDSMPAPAAPSAPRFADVQAILNDLIKGCDMQSIRDVHDDANFGWDTLDQLKNTVVKPMGDAGPAYPLIDMALVNAGKGAQTNLVIALSNPTGVDYNGQMPRNPPAGRYATAAEINTIVTWLNAGMPV